LTTTTSDPLDCYDLEFSGLIFTSFATILVEVFSSLLAAIVNDLPGHCDCDFSSLSLAYLMFIVVHDLLGHSLHVDNHLPSPLTWL